MMIASDFRFNNLKTILHQQHQSAVYHFLRVVLTTRVASKTNTIPFIFLVLTGPRIKYYEMQRLIKKFSSLVFPIAPTSTPSCITKLPSYFFRNWTSCLALDRLLILQRYTQLYSPNPVLRGRSFSSKLVFPLRFRYDSRKARLSAGPLFPLLYKNTFSRILSFFLKRPLFNYQSQGYYSWSLKR